jgi:hypothetical protein
MGWKSEIIRLHCIAHCSRSYCFQKWALSCGHFTRIDTSTTGSVLNSDHSKRASAAEHLKEIVQQFPYGEAFNLDL